jgi:hypothetical protein
MVRGKNRDRGKWLREKVEGMERDRERGSGRDRGGSMI